MPVWIRQFREEGAPMHDQDTIQRLVNSDGRYRRDAYAFTLDALNYTLRDLRQKGHSGHIDGRQLCEGIREFAEQSFGYLTRTTFHQWGITKTADFGEIVFAMVNEGLLSRQDSDSKEDFEDAYDFDEVFETKLIYD